MSGDLVDVPGVLVGHWTHPTERTGCTVVVLPEANEAAVEVRGAAPGSRETDLLRPGMSVRRADAIVLSGGSAFGLGTADGVMAALEADGRGHPTPFARIPIVPAAVIFDLAGRDATVRPDAAAGAAAYRSASTSPTTDRWVGAGAGATVAKWRGPDAVRRGGIGTASVQVGEAVVGALVVVNAIGDVVDLAGRPLTGWDPTHPHGPMAGKAATGTSTTLVVVATNGSGCSVDRMALRAQDALAATIRPAHTGHDGDIAFAVRVGEGPAIDRELCHEAAFWAVGTAIAAAVGDS